MPTPVTANYPRPKNWDELEDIVADLMRREWDDPNVTRNGRLGQAQNGVDLYGQPKHFGRAPYAGVQCKCKGVLRIDDVVGEVEKAKAFKPLLVDYTRIHTMSYVNADEGRHLIPLPRSQTDLTITPLQYRIGKIINIWYELDQALLQAGISVRDSAEDGVNA